MCIVGAEESQHETMDELFFGSIKSFNARRGFGFVACEETAKLYGRDVYISKDEAMTLANAPAVGQTAPDIAKTFSNERSKVAPVQEGDFLSFKVKLSTEGFPQAVQVRKIRRLRGVLSQPPCSTADGIIRVTGTAETEAIALERLLGADVRLPQSACGQLQLAPDDEIAFCCVNTLDIEGQALEAYRVDLLRTSRVAGSVLGCFSLTLPRSANKNVTDADDGASTAASSEDALGVELHGQAYTDRVILSEIPSDFTDSDLARFFGKIGGQASPMTCTDESEALGCRSITFSTTEQVAKFLSQSTHTVSENGVTQLARLGPCFHRQCGSSCRHCACKAWMSPSACEVPVGNVDQTPPAEPPMMEHISNVACAPCMSCSAAPQLAQDTIYSTWPSSSALPQLDQDSHAQPAGILPAPALSMPARASVPDWRCIHGGIVVAAQAPEMMAMGDNGCSVYLQWPTVVHATAYVVELVDRCTEISQRFVRAMSADALPVVTDLRIDGLRPGSYAACVRCVAPCGCESACSPWATLPVGTMPSYGAPPPAISALHAMPPSAPAPIAALFPDLCPPPPSSPPFLPLDSLVPAATGSDNAIDTVGNCKEAGMNLD